MSIKPVRYCLAIDQGTFSTRASLYDGQGLLIHSSQQAIQLNRIDHRRVEQNADEIRQSLVTVLEKLFASSPVDYSLITSAGLATQRSSIVAWRPSNGDAISPVLSWQDTRGSDWLHNFEDQADYIQERTGLHLSAHYGASKIHWLLENNHLVQQAVTEKDCVITPIASYLLFHITDNNVPEIDIANASRSLLCNLKQKSWDDELLALFGIPVEILPGCRPIAYNYGTINSTRIKLLSVNGDQTAALYANGEPDPNVLSVNLGTGAFALTSIPPDKITSSKFQQSGLLAGISKSDLEQASYYIEGTVNGAGASLEWLENQLLNRDMASLLQQDFSNIVPGIFINSVGGIGSPVWRSDLTPCFLDGLDFIKEPARAVAAVLESIVFLLQLNIQKICSIKPGIERITISGGPSNNEYLCQSLSNLTGLRVERSQNIEATSRGIAWLALGESTNWQRPATENIYRPRLDHLLESRFTRFTAYLDHLT